LNPENIPEIGTDPIGKFVIPPPKYDIGAILEASIAAADLEMANSATSKKRKLDASEGNQSLGTSNKSKSRVEEEIALDKQLNFSTSRVDFILMNERMLGKSKVQFISPVNLAQLHRKPPKQSSRIVPLIEPDICNFMKVEILPAQMIPLQNKIVATHELISQLNSEIEEYELRYLHSMQQQQHQQEQQQQHQEQQKQQQQGFGNGF
jgi:hypothetical protein